MRDIITPGVCFQVWSAPLDYQDFTLATYPMETVEAEKLEAAVALGINDSRMKDFYDLHWLQSHLDFDGSELTKAVTNPFARRASIISESSPVPFTVEFGSDAQKLEQWAAFLREGKLEKKDFSAVLGEISNFLLPV